MPQPGRPAVVFFERRIGWPRCARLARHGAGGGGELVVVTSDPPPSAGAVPLVLRYRALATELSELYDFRDAGGIVTARTRRPAPL